MPAEIAIVVTGVVLAFGGFALVLAWADHYTHSHTKS